MKTSSTALTHTTASSPDTKRRPPSGRAHAACTSVPVEKTQDELRDLLSKHGAIGVRVSPPTGPRIGIMFTIGTPAQDFNVVLPLPRRPELGDEHFITASGATDLEEYEMHLDSWHRRCRERWRAVLLMVKANLELVRLGMLTPEKAFLSSLILDETTGRTAHRALAAAERDRGREDGGR